MYVEKKCKYVFHQVATLEYRKYINKNDWGQALDGENPSVALICFFSKHHKNQDELKMAIDNVDISKFETLFKYCLETAYLLSKNIPKESLYYVQQILRTDYFHSLFSKELSILRGRYINGLWNNQDIKQDRLFIGYFLNFLSYYVLSSTECLSNFVALIDDTLRKINQKANKFTEEITQLQEIKNQIYQDQSKEKIIAPNQNSLDIKKLSQTNQSIVSSQQQPSCEQLYIEKDFQPLVMPQRAEKPEQNIKQQQQSQSPTPQYNSTQQQQQDEIHKENDQVNQKNNLPKQPERSSIKQQDIHQNQSQIFVPKTVQPQQQYYQIKQQSSQDVQHIYIEKPQQQQDFVKNQQDNEQQVEKTKSLKNYAREQTYQNQESKYSGLKKIKKQQIVIIPEMSDVRESFRHCPIEPTILEFKDPQDNNYVFGGAIFRSRESQPYQSTIKFLNNHFFILREDYMKDFRRQVQKLKETGFSNVSKSVISHLFLYYDALIENIEVTNKGFQFAVSMTAFDPRNRQINWKRTKRLMSGSLILLSTVKLEFMIFGTVLFRPEQTRDNSNRITIGIQLIGIQIKEQLQQINLLLTQKDSIIAIENQVYFESYVHFLKCIQQINVDRFPFQQQIVFASNFMPLPGYLDSKQIKNEGIFYDIDLKFDLHKQSEIGKVQRVNILREWPKLSNESLDESQLKAVQIMLKNGIALIQGPPGTGKTYCGALGVRILLQNQFKWNPQYAKWNKPIIIVCQTNHALDQFLHHILTFCYEEDIVRIGGRCKIPEFEKMLLSTSREQRKIHFPFHKLIKVRDELDRKLSQLLNFVDNIHFFDVEEFQPKITKIIISEYLTIEDAFFEKQLSEESQKELVHMWLEATRPNDDHFQKILEIEYQHNNKLVRNQQNKLKFAAIIKLNIDRLKQNIVQLSEKAQQKLKENEYDGVDENDEIDSEEEENRKILSKLDSSNEHIEKLISDKRSIKRLLNRLGRDNEVSFNELMKSFADDNFMIWSLKQSQRNIISRHIFNQKYDRLFEQVKLDIKEYENYILELNDAYIDSDLDYIQQKKIVGVTLAGCAKYAEKLGYLDCNIMIVEEAGEVLESNLIAVLSKNINHLILIGDHQQLKPSLNSYDIEVKFKANISLFERLVKNGLEYATLSYQRRMKSEFADFIRLIYTDYRDHADIQIQNKIKIKGLKHDILFYSHKEQENQDEFSSSKSNSYEVEMIYRLTEYLIKNGTKEHQITILTTYIKQALILQKRMMGYRIKVQTIDNYQGEENDIILLSLVRSNYQNNLGFVAIDNRVCVALSRARLALYIFGNFGFIENCLQNELKQPPERRTQCVTDLWLKIIALAKKKKVLLDHIPLECSSHNEITRIYDLKDWIQVRNGGCKKKCNIKFPCGHICQDVCHIFDHKQQNCRQLCDKKLQCGHYCISKCNVIPCPPCIEKVEKQLPGCKHKVRIECSKSMNFIVCRENCTKIAPCGHKCSLQCGDNCNNNRCQALINVTMDQCKHVIQVKCADKNQVNKLLCTKDCGKKLQCGHDCAGQCGQCIDRFHSPCGQKCDKILYCRHKCKKMCGVKCYGCKEQCQVYCNCKIRCPNACQLECKTCWLSCKLECEHSQCTKSCFEICDRKPCDQPCTKVLDCGCDCLGLCGEECPDICYDESHTQNENTTKNTQYYKLECQNNHIFEVDELDKYFHSLSVDKLIQCPKCHTIVWRSSRYQNYIKQSLVQYNEQKEADREQMQVDENRIDELEYLVNTGLNFVKQNKLKDQNSFLDNIKQTLKKEKKKLEEDCDSNLTFQEYECIKNQLQVYEKAQKLNNIQVTNKQFQVNKIVLLDNYLFNEEFQQQSYSSFWWKITQKLETLLFYNHINIKYEGTKDNFYSMILDEIEDEKFFLEDLQLKEFEDIIKDHQQNQ